MSRNMTIVIVLLFIMAILWVSLPYLKENS